MRFMIDCFSNHGICILDDLCDHCHNTSFHGGVCVWFETRGWGSACLRLFALMLAFLILLQQRNGIKLLVSSLIEGE